MQKAEAIVRFKGWVNNTVDGHNTIGALYLPLKRSLGGPKVAALPKKYDGPELFARSGGAIRRSNLSSRPEGIATLTFPFSPL